MAKSISEKIAKAIRVLTVPPVMVTLFVLLLWNSEPSIFSEKMSLLVSIATLGFFPVLAYVFCAIVPVLKKGGRDTQRRLAFLFTFLGYLVAWMYGYIWDLPEELILIYDTYFLSVILLLFLNFVVKIKASGHACSVSGPLVLSIYYIGAALILPCLLIEVVSFWASMKTKRHTLKQLIIGAVVAVAAFFASYVRYQIAIGG